MILYVFLCLLALFNDYLMHFLFVYFLDDLFTCSYPLCYLLITCYLPVDFVDYFLIAADDHTCLLPPPLTDPEVQDKGTQ